MPLDPVFERCFAPLIGQPCWQVRSGHGSFVTLEFGEPYLEVREPRGVAAHVSARVREMLSHRNITVRGQWHLWVYCCDWSVFDRDRVVGCSDDSESFAAATQFLDGQILTAASTDSGSVSEFRFDLGGRMTTGPRDDDGELWMLYQPDGNVLTLRANGSYCCSPANGDPNMEEWLPSRTP